MKEPRDAYKVLQVDPEADLDVIKAAYRRLAQKYHPDRALNASDADEAAGRMVEINAAWDQLRDVTRRIEYDRRRRMSASFQEAKARSAQAPTQASAPRAGRTAEPERASFDAPGTAGPPPGRPSGSVLNFGRYSGWSLGEVGRTDPSYLEWLDRMPIGRPFRREVDAILRRMGRRRGEQAEATERRGLFRRR